MDYNTSSINSRNTSSGGGGMNVSLDDLLSAADFDAVKFINARFPDEQSLEDLDRFVVGITARIGAVDEVGLRYLNRSHLRYLHISCGDCVCLCKCICVGNITCSAISVSRRRAGFKGT